MDEQLPDSDAVLPNKLGITDPEVLKTAEAEICHIRTVELAVKPVEAPSTSPARSGPSTYPRATPHSAGQPTLMPRNAIHPFRDGNGRAIRIFLQQLAANAGYDLAYRDADEEGLMRADIAAFGGNYEQLESIYASILHPLSDHS